MLRYLPASAALAASLFVGARAEETAINPLGATGEWQLVFLDEFDGASLDPEKWTSCFWWENNGCTNLGIGELSWYQPDNVRIAGGSLRLTARRQEVTGHEGRVFGFTSGMVTTGRYYEEDRPARFGITYGYIEVRARIPRGQGLWPAVWMLPSSHESRPEIDLLEVLGHDTRTMRMHFHYMDSAGEPQSVGNNVTFDNIDLAKGWHVYGLEWNQDHIAWYLDGVEQWKYKGPPIPSEELYLVINLAVGGEYSGPPDGNTSFPAEMTVDYVRGWKRKLPQ